MPAVFHRRDVCPEDETCIGCVPCYTATGETVCAGCCPHAVEDDDSPEAHLSATRAQWSREDDAIEAHRIRLRGQVRELLAEDVEARDAMVDVLLAGIDTRVMEGVGRVVAVDALRMPI